MNGPSDKVNALRPPRTYTTSNISSMGTIKCNDHGQIKAPNHTNNECLVSLTTHSRFSPEKSPNTQWQTRNINPTRRPIFSAPSLLLFPFPFAHFFFSFSLFFHFLFSLSEFFLCFFFSSSHSLSLPLAFSLYHAFSLFSNFAIRSYLRRRFSHSDFPGLVQSPKSVECSDRVGFP